MRKILLHVGAHKTGSTFINSVFKSSGQFFNKHRSVYIKHGGGFLIGNNISIEDDKSVFLKKIKKYSNIDNFIISNEGLMGDRYSLYSNNSDMAKKIKYILNGMDVKIVMFVRRQDSFIESLYNQSIKEGRVVEFCDFVKTISSFRLNWDNYAQNFKREFGDKNVKVFVYEDLFNNINAYMATIFSVIGMPKPPDIKISVVNPSLSHKGIEIAKACREILNDIEFKKLRLFLQENFYKSPGDSAGLFEREERKIIMDSYFRNNLELFSKHIENLDIKEWYK